MSPYLTLLLFPAGIVAGFLNVVAGGGSLITMPALIFLGLPSVTANGTNRIALVGQNLMAIIRFRRSGFHDLRTGLLLGIPAICGALVGARFAVTMDDLLFRRVLSVVMVLVMVGILLKGRGKAKGADAPAPQSETLGHRWLQPLLFLGVGLYGGFIQAGVGYILLFALSAVGGLSLVRANSIKVVVVGLYMLPSLLVFVADGRVAWLPGLVLTAGNSLGGWLGSAFSIKGGDRWIRWVLAVAVLAMAVKLTGALG